MVAKMELKIKVYVCIKLSMEKQQQLTVTFK